MGPAGAESLSSCRAIFPPAGCHASSPPQGRHGSLGRTRMAPPLLSLPRRPPRCTPFLVPGGCGRLLAFRSPRWASGTSVFPWPPATPLPQSSKTPSGVVAKGSVATSLICGRTRGSQDAGPSSRGRRKSQSWPPRRATSSTQHFALSAPTPPRPVSRGSLSSPFLLRNCW